MHRTGLWVMAMLYIAAGINHFIAPQTYLRIMPPWIGMHAAMVAVSGIAEVALGGLLLPVSTRRIAAWGVIALLVAVFPANIQMAIDWQRTQHPYLCIAYLRLPMQLLLIAWAWRYTRPPASRRAVA